MTIDKTRVFEACDALAAQGLENAALTNSAVREALGGRGSFSTLAPLVRAWKEARTAARVQAPVPMPGALGAHSTRLLETLWAASVAAARETAQRDVAAALATERASAAEALAEVARLEAQLTLAGETHAAVLTAADEVRLTAEGLRSALGATTERAVQAEARAAEERTGRERATTQRDTAREEAAELRGMLKALRPTA